MHPPRRFAVRADLFVLAVLAILPGCCSLGAAPDDLTSVVEYIRSGGFAGTFEQIIVQPNGDFTSALNAQNRTGRLTDAQRKELAELLCGWQFLFVPPPLEIAPVAFSITISYNGNTQSVTVTTPYVPDQFRKVQAFLERLAN